MSHVTDPVLIDPKAATWISKNVLTRTYLKSVGGIKLVRLCSCQLGQCGHCMNGDHGKCPSRTRPPVTGTLARIVNRRGGAVADVHGTGTPCRWVCPCKPCAENPPVMPEMTTPRRARGDLQPGDTVWLTPKTIGCPAICWKQPRCAVVSVSAAYIVVQVDGQDHRIHVDNVRRSDPQAKPSAPRPPRPRQAMPDGYAEQSLF
jgi:hypothetical protein